MSQVIAFANNQTMTTTDAANAVITSDPVPLNGFDRATAHFLVESLFNPLAGSGNGISYQGEVSLDGVHWVPVSGLTGFATSVGTPPAIVSPPPVVAVNGAFLRFVFTLKAAASSVAGTTFDLHVLLDHA